MRPQEHQPADPMERIRKLVAEFTANGNAALEKMNGAELLLLLSQKQLHLGMVAGRCERGEGLHVNVPLKRILEGYVREIGRAADRRRDYGHER